MTGARQMATLISQLHHTHQKIGVISMCYGIGGVSHQFHSKALIGFIFGLRFSILTFFGDYQWM
jgi:hypothetical protein